METTTVKLYSLDYSNAKTYLAASLFVVGNRSEEHTSELQSLREISYAVFCLKKKRIGAYKVHHKT